MSSFDLAAAVGAIAIFTLVALALVRHTLNGPNRAQKSFVRNRDGSFNAVCAVCAARTAASPDALVKLSSAEKALVVREQPSAVGKDLYEFVCPQCDASHCFSVNRNAMQLVGVNLYEGQHAQALCKECRKPLHTPPWPAGAYDGRLDAAPGAIDDLGMRCPFCGAACCISCCRITTRNRTADGSLLCPRCFRGPLVEFFHPESLAAPGN